MSPAPEIENTIPVPVNARSQIEKRLAEGRISWTGPLVLVAGRSAFWLALQSLLALVFLALHRPAPFRTAGQWWPLYANFGDFGCLLCMKYFTRKEGIRLRDLIGPIRMRWGRDAFLGLAILAVAYPCALAGSYLRAGVGVRFPGQDPRGVHFASSRPAHLGHGIQLDRVVGDPVTHRRNDLQRICVASAAGPLRPHLDRLLSWDSGGPRNIACSPSFPIGGMWSIALS